MKQWLYFRKPTDPHVNIWTVLSHVASWVWIAWLLSRGHFGIALFYLFVFGNAFPKALLTRNYIFINAVDVGIWRLRGLSEYRITAFTLDATVELNWKGNARRNRRKVRFQAANNKEVLRLIRERLDATGAVDAELDFFRSLKPFDDREYLIRHYERTGGIPYEKAKRAIEAL